jgi:hypothetical protein
MNDREDLGDRGALSSELAIDRGVLALDALPQAQEFSVIAHAGDLQVGLPSAHVDYLFQLRKHRLHILPFKKQNKNKKNQVRRLVDER